jgi:uncharacterized membrane protein (DUF485 family)
MSESAYQALANNPKFQELVRSRTSFAWTMSFIILAAYLGFILLIAFDPGFLATPLYEGATTTVGIPVGVGVIVFAFILTGIYVVRANGRFDELTQELIKDVSK